MSHARSKTAVVVADGQAPPWAHDLARQVSMGLSASVVPKEPKDSLPPAVPAAQVIYVPDATAGATLAYSDGATWHEVLSANNAAEINVKMFGATGDGTTDDTVAIQSAITAAEAAGSPLRFPAGTYLVEGSGAAIFTITKPIHVLGDGYNTLIKVNAAVPTTRDVFLFTGTADAIGRAFLLFSDFRIAGAVAGVARYGINLTTPSNAYMFRAAVERIEFTNLSNYGVWIDTSAASSVIHTSWVRDCRFVGNGIGGISVYDSVIIENCQLAGIGYAINISHVAGAGKCTLRNCNVTASSGVHLGDTFAAHALIENNYFEVLQTYTGTSGAFVNLQGASGSPILGPVIENNIFTVLSGFGDPDAFRLNFVNDAIVRSNWFHVLPAASFCVVVTGNANRTLIANDNVYNASGAGKLSDAGIGTIVGLDDAGHGARGGGTLHAAATVAAAGFVSTGAQSFGGVKTFTAANFGAPSLASTTATGLIAQAAGILDIQQPAADAGTDPVLRVWHGTTQTAKIFLGGRAEFPGGVSPGSTTVLWTSGVGTPEGVVTAVRGSLFTRIDGGASTTLYVKESGSGATGWIAK